MLFEQRSDSFIEGNSLYACYGKGKLLWRLFMNKSNTASIMKELNHQYRTMNMWLTIYEKLHARYRIRAWLLELILLLASILLCLTTFVDQKILQFLQVSVEESQMILWISSFIIFGIAIISLIINWKEKAANFNQAINSLNKIQIDCREQLKLEMPEELWDLKTKSLIYTSVINDLPKITERDFHKLKAFHKRQLELDKMIDLYPGSSVWLLKLFTFFRANIHVLLRKPFINNNCEDTKKVDL
jgi:hypothetical protein